MIFKGGALMRKTDIKKRLEDMARQLKMRRLQQLQKQVQGRQYDYKPRLILRLLEMGAQTPEKQVLKEHWRGKLAAMQDYEPVYAEIHQLQKELGLYQDHQVTKDQKVELIRRLQRAKQKPVNE